MLERRFILRSVTDQPVCTMSFSFIFGKQDFAADHCRKLSSECDSVIIVTQVQSRHPTSECSRSTSESSECWKR